MSRAWSCTINGKTYNCMAGDSLMFGKFVIPRKMALIFSDWQAGVATPQQAEELRAWAVLQVLKHGTGATEWLAGIVSETRP